MFVIHLDAQIWTCIVCGTQPQLRRCALQSRWAANKATANHAGGSKGTVRSTTKSTSIGTNTLARWTAYVKARESSHERWSGSSLDWRPTGAVTLNPERDSVDAAHEKAEQPLAASMRKQR